MKQLILILVTIALCSCGLSHSPTSRNHVTLELQNSKVQESYLLSVRERSVVVAPYTNDEVTYDSLIGKAKVVPISDIEKIYRLTGPSFNNMSFGPAVIGAVGGLILGYADAMNKYGGHSSVTDGVGPLGTMGIWIAGGFLSGTLFGFLINTTEREYPVDTKAHLVELKERAIYPGEEPVSLREIQ